MTKQKVGMGRTVRCPRCKYENLAIDIWCERCGTPVDWQGLSNPPSANGNGQRKPVKNGNGRPGGLAALAGGLPWMKHQAPTATKTVAAPSAPAPVAKPPAAVPPAPPPIVTALPPPQPSPQGGGSAEGKPAVQGDGNEKGVAAASEVPVAAPARVFCAGCGQANETSNKFCPRCGHSIAAAGAGSVALASVVRKRPQAKARRPRQAIKFPQVRLPRLSLPRMRMPRARLPRVPMVAWAIAAVVVVLLIAPLAYVLSPSGRHLSATRNSPRPSLTRTGSAPTGPTTAVAAAIPGVEAKTGLKYASGSCPSNSPCLRLSGQTTGLNAAAIQFSTAGTGGRQCAGYVYQVGGSWHFLSATCGLPGQLSPLVGSQATVHVPGQCANVRDSAALQGGIVACLNDGTSVRVDGGPNYADGKLWWHLEKNGWMAHDFLVSA